MLAVLPAALFLAAAIVAMGASKGHQGFAFDFPKYIGGSLGAMIQDIGYTPEIDRPTYSFDDGRISYGGYSLVYPQGVEIFIHFDRIVYQPPDQDEIIRDLDFFKDKTIGSMEISFRCRSEDKK